MEIPKDLNKLIELFRKLGAPNPEGWARSQHEEGINQLHRFLFLREAWKGVVSESDDSWIDANIEASKIRPDVPFAGLGQAMGRMLEKNVDRKDIVDLVRAIQVLTISDMCYILDCPELDEPELEEHGWALAEVVMNDDFEIQYTGRTINALHESVLSLDPTGREMRPRASEKN